MKQDHAMMYNPHLIPNSLEPSHNVCTSNVSIPLQSNFENSFKDNSKHEPVSSIDSSILPSSHMHHKLELKAYPTHSSLISTVVAAAYNSIHVPILLVYRHQTSTETTAIFSNSCFNSSFGSTCNGIPRTTSIPLTLPLNASTLLPSINLILTMSGLLHDNSDSEDSSDDATDHNEDQISTTNPIQPTCSLSSQPPRPSLQAHPLKHTLHMPNGSTHPVRIHTASLDSSILSTPLLPKGGQVFVFTLKPNTFKTDRRRSSELENGLNLTRDIAHASKETIACSIKESDLYRTASTPPSRYRTEFEEIEQLGRGGFGVVYRARNLLDGQEYAIKKVKLNCPPEALQNLTHSSALFDRDRASASASLLSLRNSSPSLSGSTTSTSVSPIPLAFASSFGSGHTRRLSQADDRLLREVKTFAMLSNHPNVVRYYNAWIEAPEKPLTSNLKNSSHSLRGLFPPSRSSRSSISLSDVSFDYGSEAGLESDLTEGEDSESISECDDHDEDHDHFQEAGLEEDSLRPNSLHTHNSTLYIQMQLYACQDLRVWIKSRRTVDRAHNMLIFAQLVSGLVHIHGQNIIHRDVKPENIFLKGSHVYLGDFGLAKSVSDHIIIMGEPNNNGQPLHASKYFSNDISSCDVIESSTSHGTYFYTAPEILEEQLCTTKSDIYSLGVILLELVCVFDTAMERVVVLDTLKRDGSIPEKVLEMYPEECDLIRMLVSGDPAARPTAAEILVSDFFRFEFCRSNSLSICNNGAPCDTDTDPLNMFSMSPWSSPGHTPSAFHFKQTPTQPWLSSNSASGNLAIPGEQCSMNQSPGGYFNRRMSQDSGFFSSVRTSFSTSSVNTSQQFGGSIPRKGLHSRVVSQPGEIVLRPLGGLPVPPTYSHPLTLCNNGDAGKDPLRDFRFPAVGNTVARPAQANAPDISQWVFPVSENKNLVHDSSNPNHTIVQTSDVSDEGKKPALSIPLPPLVLSPSIPLELNDRAAVAAENDETESCSPMIAHPPLQRPRCHSMLCSPRYSLPYTLTSAPSAPLMQSHCPPILPNPAQSDRDEFVSDTLNGVTPSIGDPSTSPQLKLTIKPQNIPCGPLSAPYAMGAHPYGCEPEQGDTTKQIEVERRIWMLERDKAVLEARLRAMEIHSAFLESL
ncbi:Eukaryotic translation initiation factor 2-alpha kinase 3 [Batrachochytrium dendrobatidis]